MSAAQTFDSYGTRFCLIGNAKEFTPRESTDCQWDEHHSVFRLADNQQPIIASSTHEDAMAAWQNAKPFVVDQYGQLGFLSDDAKALQYALNWQHYQMFLTDPDDATAGAVVATDETGVGQTLADVALSPVTAPADTDYIDVAIGGDGRVALPFSNSVNRHGLTMVHLSRRWQQTLALNFEPVRVLVDHLNRTWVAGDSTLALCEGEPLPQQYTPQPGRFEPVMLNPNALQQRWELDLPAGFLLIAMSLDDQHLVLVVQSEVSDTQIIWQRELTAEKNAPWKQWTLPETLPTVTDVHIISNARIALMVTSPSESDSFDAPVVTLLDEGKLDLIRKRYPLDTPQSVRFINSANQPAAMYLSKNGPRQLVALPQARFLSEGACVLAGRLDSGEYDSVWHRIYIDASIPPGCTLNVSVNAFNNRMGEPNDWQQQPAPLKVPLTSELPFHAESLSQSAKHGGVFEILLQREQGAVRDIRGRYLRVKIEMTGDGRHSPAISQMRAYYPRFSWQENYLPALFHQQSDIERGDTRPANGADLRERLLASFEGLLTPVEETIANAEAWLRPSSVPNDQLDQLTSLLGFEAPVYWPEQRKREWLAATGYLQAYKGTAAALVLALDIATEGAVRLGQIVPVENYRLRRTLATILGISMEDDDHPLTLGTARSGNSIVGPSLIISDEEAREFLALFAPELAETQDDQEAVEAFFDRYAHRLSIVIHQDARDWRQTVEHVLRVMVPGHVALDIIETDQPFVLGLSPLLGIDTYLEQTQTFRNIVLNDTSLGREGIIRNPAALSPADVNARSPEA